MMNIFGSHETSKANFSNSTKDVNSIITLQSHRFFMIVLNQFDLKLADFVKLSANFRYLVTFYVLSFVGGKFRGKYNFAMI